MHQPPEGNDDEGEQHEHEIIECDVALEVEGDDAEIGRLARDAEQSVLAAGERIGLDSNGPEDLGEGNGHEGEVDASPVRDEEPDDDTGKARRRDRRYKTDPQIGRQVELA